MMGGLLRSRQVHVRASPSVGHEHVVRMRVGVVRPLVVQARPSRLQSGIVASLSDGVGDGACDGAGDSAADGWDAAQFAFVAACCCAADC